MKQKGTRRTNPLIMALVALLGACVGDGPTAMSIGSESSGTSVVIDVAGTLEVLLGTVGPGSYIQEPTITGSALSFVDVAYVPPFYPGGPTQRFRFRGAVRGESRIVIPRVQVPGVVDTAAYVLTVVVRSR